MDKRLDYFQNRFDVSGMRKLILPCLPTIQYRHFVSELKEDFSDNSNLRIALIGGGTTGFFAAILTDELNPWAEVVLFESGNKVLRKGRRTGMKDVSTIFLNQPVSKDFFESLQKNTIHLTIKLRINSIIS